MNEAASVMAALVLIVGVPLNALATLRLYLLHRKAPLNGAIFERTVTSLAILMLVILFGTIFLNNDTIPPLIGLPWTKILTRLMVLVVAVGPAAFWLFLYHDDD